MNKLDGLYTYTVQGLMHAPKLAEPDPRKIYLHAGFAGDLQVNFGGLEPAADPNFQPKTAERPPAASGFYSPDNISIDLPPYGANFGFYPFSEAGFIFFKPGGRG